MKKSIDVYSYMNEIVSGIKDGCLITVKSGDKVNPMTISWGKIGIEWNKLIFIAYVRTGRFTHELLEKELEFTVNIPLDKRDSRIKNILSYCGTKSGRNHDKVSDLELELTNSDIIYSPGINELPLTLECNVIFSQDQDSERISEKLQKRFYPSGIDSDYPGSNKDFHTMFYGEIVNAYIIE